MIIEIRDEVVSLSGAVRSNQWAALESAVKMRLRHHPAGIVLDCSGINAITEDGAGTIRDAAAHVAGMGTGARLVLAAAPPHVIRVLRQVPNLGSQVPVAATAEEARRSLGLMPSAPRPGTPSAAAGRGAGRIRSPGPHGAGSRGPRRSSSAPRSRARRAWARTRDGASA